VRAQLFCVWQNTPIFGGKENALQQSTPETRAARGLLRVDRDPGQPVASATMSVFPPGK